jgi:UDP-N-acetylenolpyruvoylglucosamine reductase
MPPPTDILERPMADILHIADDIAGRVSPATVIRRDEPLAGHTTLRVGGPADVYVEPSSEADLAAVVKCCSERGVPFFVIGRGSNLLVRDGGFRGAVICLSHANFSRIDILVGQASCLSGRLEACPTLRCGAGAKLKAVAIEARRHGLSGMEFFEGIPGSVGGALRMNAGAMGTATFDVVESVRLMDFDGNVRELSPEEMLVKYRGCATLKNHIAMGAVFRGRPDSPESIAQRMSAFSQKRWASQPATPSAGCVFKNPPSIPAGKLIDELGLKGARVGGAVVSQEHGNFIVNDGNATARDILELIEMLKQSAKKERGIELQTEVEIIGDEN